METFTPEEQQMLSGRNAGPVLAHLAQGRGEATGCYGMSTATVETAKNAHLERGITWAADCGVPFQASGYTARMRWEYAEAAFPCTVCGVEIPAGRLAVRNSHVACIPAADWVRDGFEASDGASGRWHRDTIRATKRKGDASTRTPGAAAAAKALAKVDPLKAPRFAVKGVADPGPNPFAQPGAKVAKCEGPLAQAARAWSMAAEVARAGAPAEKAKVPPVKRAPKAEPVAPAVPDVVYVDVPAVAEPVAERPEQVARVVDHFAPTVAPVVVVESVPVLPAAVEEWLGRLVYGEKAAYARAFALSVCCGAEAPADPGTEWAAKARKRLAKVVG